MAPEIVFKDATTSYAEYGGYTQLAKARAMTEPVMADVRAVMGVGPA